MEKGVGVGTLLAEERERAKVKGLRGRKERSWPGLTSTRLGQFLRSCRKVFALKDSRKTSVLTLLCLAGSANCILCSFSLRVHT